MDPKSAAFAAEPLTTDRYSAILVASDTSCGGCDLNIGTTTSETPDSDAINARKNDIQSFFNAGGGLYANAGADHADGDPTDGADVFYNFVPIPVGGVQVSSPFCLTSAGAAIGLEDPADGSADPGGCPDASKRTGSHNDINCCATHNSFSEPEAGTALTVAERDNEGFPETLIAEGVIIGGKIVSPPPPASPPTPAAKVKAKDSKAPRVSIAGVGGGCVSRAFNARFRVTESHLRRVSVYLDGKRIARTTKKRFTVKINARRLKAGRHRVRLSAIDRTGNKRSMSRVFARCAQARRVAPHFTG
jgi:hypothetical protein